MVEMWTSMVSRNSQANGRVFRGSVRSLAALSLALLLALFLFQTASHLHANQRDDAACSRCHLSHVGLALGKTNLFLFAPLFATGQALRFVPIHPENPWFAYSSSRAPPVS